MTTLSQKQTAMLLLCAVVAASSGAAKVNEEAIREAMPDAAPARPKQPRKVLVFNLCKGFRHGCIPTAAKCLEIMGEKTGAFTTVQSEDMSVFNKEDLAEFDAILFNNTTRLEFADKPAAREAIMDFVKGGKGIVGIHAATDNFYDWPEMADLMGGVFDGHPWGAGGTWAIRNDDPDHPLNRSFAGEGFKIKDELYQLKGAYSRDTLRVLLSIDLSDQATGARKGKRADKDYGVSWIRPVGEGRLFYCSLGHNNEVFWNTPVLEHFLAGIQYALGDLECDDSPSR